MLVTFFNRFKVCNSVNIKGNKIFKHMSSTEKNIRNEITKYQLTINSEVKLLNPTNNNEISFIIKKSGTFNVADQNSTTRNNEKQLISMLSNELAKEIIKETNILLNDI